MPGSVVVVVGAAGGVGASTLAALVAGECARRGRTALVDCDPARGGLEVLLGIEGQPGARWADLDNVRARIDPEDLRGALPRWRGVEVVSADRRASRVDPAALAAVLTSLVAACGAVVVDLPARVLLGGGCAEVTDVVAAASDVLVLTGQDVLGVCGALVVRGAVGSDARLVLRRRPRARVAPAEARHVVGLPLAGLIPADRRVAEAVDRGFGPITGGWSRLARAVRHVARGTAHG